MSANATSGFNIIRAGVEFFGQLLAPKAVQGAVQAVVPEGAATRSAFVASQCLPLINPSAPWLGHLMHFERYANGIAPRPNNPLATFTQVDERFRPGSRTLTFPLPQFSAPRDWCRVLTTSDANPTLHSHYVQPTTVTVPVHPQIEGDSTVPQMDALAACPRTTVPACASSSSRTLFVDNPNLPIHCVKLHFPHQITRAQRHLGGRKIEHSVALSQHIANTPALLTNRFFGYMPESLGVIYGSGDSSWGYLVRELIPRPLTNRNHPIVPLFSLYAKDTLNPDQPALLTRLIESSGLAPEEFVLEKILYPLIHCWVDTYLKTGIILEAHGQNTLIEFNPQGTPLRFIFRDFDTFLSRDLAERSGLACDHLTVPKVGLAVGTDAAPSTAELLSLVYDTQMKVAFDQIADVMESKYGVSKETLQQKCQSYMRQVFPEGDQHFPKGEVYNYQKDAVIRIGKRSVFKPVAGQKPEWR